MVGEAGSVDVRVCIHDGVTCVTGKTDQLPCHITCIATLMQSPDLAWPTTAEVKDTVSKIRDRSHILESLKTKPSK